MEVILATRISYIVRGYNLLLRTHFRSRQGSYIETNIYNRLKKIYATWNNNGIALVLMMDVFAAYPNILHQRLLHNLCKQKINYKIIQWVTSFSMNRHTIIKTNEHINLKFSIDLGLTQSLLLLSISYLFYNADLLDENTKKRAKI